MMKDYRAFFFIFVLFCFRSVFQIYFQGKNPKDSQNSEFSEGMISKSTSGWCSQQWLTVSKKQSVRHPAAFTSSPSSTAAK